MARLRRKLARIPGARLYLTPVQDIRVGGRQSNAEYQYTILGDTTAEVYEWAPKLLAALEKDPIFSDVSSDQQQNGLETDVTVDRDTASRLGLTMYQIDNTLYDAFGQRSVSTIYNAAQPVSRRHGGGAAVLAAPRHPRPDLGQHVRRAAERIADHGAQRRLRGRGIGLGCVADRAGDAAGRRRRAPRPSLRRPTSASPSAISRSRLTNNVVPLALTTTSASSATARDERGVEQFGPHGGAGDDRVHRDEQSLRPAPRWRRRRDDDPALGLRPLRAGRHAARGQPSEPVRRGDDFVQSRARASR